MRPDDNATNDELARLRALLESQLNDPDEGLVLTEIRSRDDNATLSPADLFTKLARELGRELQADRLVEMPRATAEKLTTEMFRGSFVEVMRSEPEAASDAAAFFAPFGPDARFFSTCRYSFSETGNLSRVGAPFLENSIERGFFVVGPERFGCLWVGDEG